MGDDPAEGVDEQEVLGGVGKAVAAVSHVEIDHAIVPVGPDDGEVASEDDVFDPEREVGFRQAHQDLYGRIGPWVGIPLVVFAFGCDKL